MGGVARIIGTILFVALLHSNGVFCLPIDLAQVGALKNRVDTFWTAYAKNDSSALSKFVLKEDMPEFLGNPRIHIFGYRVFAMQMTPDGKSATVQTYVKRAFPALGGPIDWAIDSQWIYEGGDWFLHYRKETSPLVALFQSAVPQEKMKKSPHGGPVAAGPKDGITAPIFFHETAHDFGSVKPGADLSCGYSFANQGKQEVRLVRIFNPCQGEKNCHLELHVEKKAIAPGATASIDAQWEKPAADLNIDQTIEVEFDSNQIFYLHFAAQTNPPPSAKKQVAVGVVR